MAEMPDASEDRRQRVRQSIRLAAQYVARKERGEPVHWVPAGTVTRLNADGKPDGTPQRVLGPMIFSTTMENVDRNLMRTLFGR